ncbi:PAS and ANTAR domain-containing protein [Nocardia sp. NPDC005366]|uniref:PAS and ANTAR domain-containing protein n=1 Tax=Nocardia sp. NPDC005366 TaxID=3156878 RepID=UPI0033B8F7F1
MHDGGDLTPPRADIDRLERVVGAGQPQGVGGFRFLFADQSWEWSPEVARMHGYEPGEVVPTTELLLSHKHPDDRDRVEAALVTSVEDGSPFSSNHRIIDTAGTVRDVIVVSDRLLDDDERVIGTIGYYIDITGTLAEHREGALEEVLPDLVASRAVIEQAKGVLMVVYGIGPDQAFHVLRWRSQDTNTKLRTIAERLIAGLSTVAAAETRMRAQLDHLLLTAHEGTAAESPRR